MQHAQTHGTSETQEFRKGQEKTESILGQDHCVFKQNASIKKKQNAKHNKKVRLFGSIAPAGETASDMHISDLRLIQIQPLSAKISMLKSYIFAMGIFYSINLT